MRVDDLDTPALLIDQNIMEQNINSMQRQADLWGVGLRPHTKTHKMPYVASLQLAAGASGITVAKTGEAEVMAANGISDIFIANEIVGHKKLERILALAKKGATISFGVDSLDALKQISQVFSQEFPAHVLVEIETGENRSGIIRDESFLELIRYMAQTPAIHFKGVFSHEGHTYKAKDHADCLALFAACQKLTLHFAQLARENGLACTTVSIGSTPSLLIAAIYKAALEPGITEIRPGTYVFMDAAQGNAIGSHQSCAATVLATIISKPTDERVIADAGAKALTMQTRTEGICATVGKGLVLNHPGVTVDSVYDEHTIFYHKAFHDSVGIGDTIQIIPNHICPVVNLYDQAYVTRNGAVERIVPILCRGKTQ
jgi:D-serine deaminase-like pyridoxal phosphate-dependent protein